MQQLSLKQAGTLQMGDRIFHDGECPAHMVVRRVITWRGETGPAQLVVIGNVHPDNTCALLVEGKRPTTLLCPTQSEIETVGQQEIRFVQEVDYDSVASFFKTRAKIALWKVRGGAVKAVEITPEIAEWAPERWCGGRPCTGVVVTR